MDSSTSILANPFSLFFQFTHFVLYSVWNVIFTAESSKQKCRFRCAQPRVGKYFFKPLLWRRCAFYERSSVQTKSTSLRWNLDSTITGLLALSAVKNCWAMLRCKKLNCETYDEKLSRHDYKRFVRRQACSLIIPGFNFELSQLDGIFNGIDEIS